MGRFIVLVLISIILGACGSLAPGGVDPSRRIPLGGLPTAGAETSDLDAAREPFEDSEGDGDSGRNPRIDDPNVYRYSKLLADDAIRPVYDPQFIPPEDAPLKDDELVMGVALDGEAKAYPISVLRFREMVNDDLAGMHILVTW